MFQLPTDISEISLILLQNFCCSLVFWLTSLFFSIGFNYGWPPKFCWSDNKEIYRCTNANLITFLKNFQKSDPHSKNNQIYEYFPGLHWKLYSWGQFGPTCFYQNFCSILFPRVEKNYVRNALKCADFSKTSAQKPCIKMRWIMPKCAEILQETRWKPLSFRKLASTVNRTLLSGAVAFTQSTAALIPEILLI